MLLRSFLDFLLFYYYTSVSSDNKYSKIIKKLNNIKKELDDEYYFVKYFEEFIEDQKNNFPDEEQKLSIDENIMLECEYLSFHRKNYMTILTQIQVVKNIALISSYSLLAAIILNFVFFM